MTPELIRALLDRGDAFLSMADIKSARLFYERAAAVGNPQAALRLGLTYDPSFLAQAGLSSVRGDLAEAHSWLQRARALGTSDADVPSIGRTIESPRTTERVVTGSPTEPATEDGTTGQASTQFLNDPALSVGAGKRTRPATVRSSPSTSANQRHTRTHQNGPICPHAGQCLTPP